MIQVLGLADTMAGVIFLAQAIGVEVPFSMALFFAVYLIVKGGIFVVNSLDWGSALDVTAGIVLLLASFFSLPGIFFGIFEIILITKGLLSLLA